VLTVGDRAPEATVFLGPHEPVTIAELVEDGPKLLFFFPFAWSSTCTNEMELLRDRKEEFDALGCTPSASNSSFRSRRSSISFVHVDDHANGKKKSSFGPSSTSSAIVTGSCGPRKTVASGARSPTVSTDRD